MSLSLNVAPNQLSRLIGIAYDAALDPLEWQRFSHEASQATSTTLALLLFIDHGEPARSFAVAGGGVGAEFLARFQEQWNPDLEGEEDLLWNAIRDESPGAVWSNLEVLTREELRQSRIYQRLGAPWNLEHLMTGVVTNSIGVSAYLTLGRHGDDTPFTDDDKGLVRETMLTHIRRSFSLHRSLDVVQSHNGVLTSVLDRAPYGMVVFDALSRPILVNQRAEVIFQGANGITLRNGCLRSPYQNTQAQLDWSLSLAMETARGRVQQGAPPAVHIPPTDGRGFEVVFAPLNYPSSRPNLPPGAACVVLIHEAGVAPSDSAVSNAISGVYGLTPAEVRLCEALFRGQSLPEAADALDISRNTAKTHLARIFDKTGVRSQIALLRLLAFGPRINGA